MAGINSEITISTEKRLCVVDGKKALFHNWAEISYPVGESPMIGGPSAGQVSYVVALVEYEDGTVEKVDLNNQKFVFADGLVNQMWHESAAAAIYNKIQEDKNAKSFNPFNRNH